MSQELIDRSPDLRRLVDEGYSLELKFGYALINDIPYINARKELRIGTLLCALTLAGNTTSRPSDHVIYFIGEHPCNADGSIMTGIVHNSTSQDLGNGLIANHSFSNKPLEGFENYYDKFVSYINIISAPVHLVDPDATAKLFKPVNSTDNGIFNYRDSNASRANINGIVERLQGQKIGIVGLGGTGSYILDMVAKTPVAEIHLFDGDRFYSHNAFRAPGAASIADLEAGLYKTDYFSSMYGKMHRGIVSHTLYLGPDDIDLLLSLDFVFLSLDSGTSKKVVIEFLKSKGIPFADTGIGIKVQGNMLSGTTRVTAVIAGTDDSWKKRVSLTEVRDDIYSSNIQIAEINNLCSTLAVIKWKKLNGIYDEQERNDFITFDISMGEIVNEN